MYISKLCFLKLYRRLLKIYLYKENDLSTSTLVIGAYLKQFKKDSIIFVSKLTFKLPAITSE